MLAGKRWEGIRWRGSPVDKAVEVFRLATLAVDIALLYFIGKNVKRNPKRWLTIAVAAFCILHYLPERVFYPRLKEWANQRQAEKVLSENHALAALVRARPELRREMLVAVVRAMDERRIRTNETYENPLTEILVRVFPDYAAVASDDSILAFARAVHEVLRALEQSDPDLCVDWIRTKVKAPALGPSVGISLVAELERTIGQVVETAVIAPQDPPDASRAEATVRRLMASIVAMDDAQQESAAPPGTEGESSRVCSTARKMYGAYLTLPSEEGSNTLRYLLGRSSPIQTDS